MGNNLTAIFLDYFENPETAVPLIKRVLGGVSSEALIVSSNFDTRFLAGLSNVKVIYFGELLNREDCAFMYRYVFHLTENWYGALEAIEGLNRHKEVSFGKIIEEKAQRLFTTAIKNLEIILKMNERFNPGRIILIGERDTFRNLGRFIEEELKTPVSFVVRRHASETVRLVSTELILSLFDGITRLLMLFARRNKRGIFIDSRLYDELTALPEVVRPHLYLIEKGGRVRLKLLQKKHMFTPLFTENTAGINKMFNPMRQYWQSLREDASFKGRFIYKDLDIWRVVEKFIEELVVFDFLQARKNILLLERVYAILRPRLVVLREAARGIEKSIALVARSNGIPTLVVQHGILAEGNIYSRLHSDWVALWGWADIERYAMNGNNTAGCVVTGKPLHDKIAAEPAFSSASGREGKTILYIADLFKRPRHLLHVYYSKDMEYYSLKNVVDAMEAFPDKQLMVKPHPFDAIADKTLADYQKHNRGAVVIADRKEDIVSLISQSELVIVSNFSSAALDAVILGKPIIVFNFLGCEDLVPYADRGVAVRVTRPEEIRSAIRRILEDKKLNEYLASNRKDFIYDYAYKIDRKSNERVLALIKRLYEGGNGIKREEARDLHECAVNKSAV